MSTVDEAWLDTRQDCSPLPLPFFSYHERNYLSKIRANENGVGVLHQFSILRKRVLICG